DISFCFLAKSYAVILGKMTPSLTWEFMHPGTVIQIVIIKLFVLKIFKGLLNVLSTKIYLK
ncbi:MAG: hypothetical protein BV457_09400, partial [Thermoplasmata archaeon M9B1D]